MIFWTSLTLTGLVLAGTLPLGGPELFGFAAATLLLPHLFIGDLFHWNRFPRLEPAEKRLWLSLAALGLGVFLAMRQAGELALPLFYTYFFGHFWKDLDLTWGRVDDPSDPALRRPKRWCGVLLLVGYAVISSGLVRDPWIVASAERAAWMVAAGLLGAGGVAWRRIRLFGRPLDALWARYATLSACLLLLSTWLDAFHPFRSLFPHAVITWHFMAWYVFYGSVVRRTAGGAGGEPRYGLDRLKHSLAGLTALAVGVNVLSAGGAWLYGSNPDWAWLRYVYNYHYLAGCWTVMHVTWDWVPKVIRGVRLAVV